MKINKSEKIMISRSKDNSTIISDPQQKYLVKLRFTKIKCQCCQKLFENGIAILKQHCKLKCEIFVCDNCFEFVLPNWCIKCSGDYYYGPY